MSLDWIKHDMIFYPTVLGSYFILAYSIYHLILGLMNNSWGVSILCGISILYFGKLLTFITGSSTLDLGIYPRKEAVEEFNNFISEHKSMKEVKKEEGKSEQYECDICSRKISKEQYKRNDGRCPTCVAEDTHVAMFDSEGRPY